MSKGGPGAVIGAQNRQRVLDWLLSHPGGTNIECGKALGLNGMAVGRHVRKIREGWPYPAPPAVEGDLATRRHWIIVHEPGRIPEMKGGFRQAQVEPFLRELVACRPEASRYTVCSLTWDFGLWVEGGHQRLADCDALARLTDEDWAEIDTERGDA